MYLDPIYAVTPERTALGVMDAWMWAREKKNKDGQRNGPKESLCWVEGYDRIAEMAYEMPGTRLVYVADREADLMPLMLRAQRLAHLVRAAHNRCLVDGGKLFDVVTSETPMGEISFTMSSRHGVAARPVRQQLWAHRVELSADKGDVVSVCCIVAREVDTPAGIKPIEWRLLTNRHASSVDEVTEPIDWYRARWEIEMLFDILKNACRVEALRLSAFDRLERAPAMFMVVAWRVAYLMRLGRASPEFDAERYFD